MFDLDGTLIDTVDLIHRSFDHAVRTVLGRRLSKEELLRNMGRPLMVQMKSLAPEKAEALLLAYNEHNLAQHDKHISVYPGTVATLTWLRDVKQVKLGVVTSKKRDLCLRGLVLMDLADFFPVVIAMEDTTHHKPDPEPIEAALTALGCSANEAVFVGDSPYDIQAGASAGTVTVAALWGPFSRSALMEQGPDHVLSNLAGLQEILA